MASDGSSWHTPGARQRRGITMGTHQAVLYVLGLVGSLMAQPWLTWKELPQPNSAP